jgi:outer membrane receptor protein involved in Fe transport
MVRAPGYTLFSLGGSYQLSERYRVSFNVDNLFDKNYWEKVSYPGRQNFFGEPRRFTLSLRASM